MKLTAEEFLRKDYPDLKVTIEYVSPEEFHKPVDTRPHCIFCGDIHETNA